MYKRIINGIYWTIGCSRIFICILKDSFTGDGSTTTFDLANDVVRGAENVIEVLLIM